MEHIHRQEVMHRDLKSLNILIRGDGEALVSDFGISKLAAGMTSSTTAAGHCGSCPWMAPEYLEGDFSNKSDVYSFAMVLWELITCELPWWSEVLPVHIITKVKDGQRPNVAEVCDEDTPEEMPNVAEGCYEDTPKEMIRLMKQSWNQEPSLRPTFSDIVSRLEKICRLFSKEDTPKEMIRLMKQSWNQEPSLRP